MQKERGRLSWILINSKLGSKNSVIASKKGHPTG